MSKIDLADRLAGNGLSSLGDKIRVLASLSWPAMMAQMSTILMEYIDASMVGSLGEVSSAAIGLVATTTWLFGGLCTAAVTGFSVQVAHRVGAGDDVGAREVLRRSVTFAGLISLVLMAVGMSISSGLPYWLGGRGDVCVESTSYFFVFSLSMPVMFMTYLAGAMLRCSGNMVIPGVANVVMCVLDVVFNFFLIFETRDVNVLGCVLTIPGAGLGVTGAALGTMCAVICAGGWMVLFLNYKSRRLSHPFALRYRRANRSRTSIIYRAMTISWPVALERVVMCGAQILITAIVAPLGNVAIAANAFAVTAESLCYMSGYGISEAATTLVGQSLGAGRKDLTLSFGRIAVVSGMLIMGILGVVMWLFAPEMMSLFTPDERICDLGIMALRTEAWAEPMFGAAIVAYGVFVGAGYTLVPATINFTSIWVVRLTLSALLAPSLGLFGVWLAMCIELCVRGLSFIIVFISKRWLKARASYADN